MSRSTTNPVADVLRRVLESPNVADANGECANNIADAIREHHS
jgi:hypothetical protein